MGEPTRGGRLEPCSRDQKLRCERGQESEDTTKYILKKKRKKERQHLPDKRRGRAEREGAEHDDKQATTVTERYGRRTRYRYP